MIDPGMADNVRLLPSVEHYAEGKNRSVNTRNCKILASHFHTLGGIRSR